MSCRFKTAFLLPLLLLTACQEQQDNNGILNEHALIDVLYDYQLAVALAEQEAPAGKTAETEYRYTQAVLAKHGITDQTFELSLAHYARNPKTMLQITEAVNMRLTGEKNEVNTPTQNESANATVADDMEASTPVADTTLVWKHTTGIVLNANGRNRIVWDLPAARIDGHQRLLLRFSPQWVYREGSKNAVVTARITYSNDSVAVFNENIREYQDQQLMTIPLAEGRKLKSLTLQVFQTARWQPYPQMLCLSNFSLVGIKAATQHSTPQKTSSTDTANDSTALHTDTTARGSQNPRP